MIGPSISPGQSAPETFTLGMIAAGLLALCVVGIVYWAGLVEPLEMVFHLLLWLPIYFFLVTILLSKWLGLAPEITDLEPVSPEE
jgi:hypothetical protein